MLLNCSPIAVLVATVSQLCFATVPTNEGKTVAGDVRVRSLLHFPDLMSNVSVNEDEAPSESEVIVGCVALSYADLWRTIYFRRCPAVPEQCYLQWPFDVYPDNRLHCGLGPKALSVGGWNTSSEVRLMNASAFLETVRALATLADNRLMGDSGSDWCLLANFYAPGCPFSVRLAPFYNALPKVFPRLFVVAVDATEFSKLNHRYGIAGTPTLLLWHNAKVVARYAEAEYSMDNLVEFLSKRTDLQMPDELSLSVDSDGPLPTTALEVTDGYLLAAVMFTVFVCGFYAGKTPAAARCLDFVRRHWLNRQTPQPLMLFDANDDDQLPQQQELL